MTDFGAIASQSQVRPFYEFVSRAKFKVACYARSHEEPFHRNCLFPDHLHHGVCGGLFSTEDERQRRLQPPGKGGRTDRSGGPFAICISMSFCPKCTEIRSQRDAHHYMSVPETISQSDDRNKPRTALGRSWPSPFIERLAVLLTELV